MRPRVCHISRQAALSEDSAPSPATAGLTPKATVALVSGDRETDPAAQKLDSLLCTAHPETRRLARANWGEKPGSKVRDAMQRCPRDPDVQRMGCSAVQMFCSGDGRRTKIYLAPARAPEKAGGDRLRLPDASVEAHSGEMGPRAQERSSRC